MRMEKVLTPILCELLYDWRRGMYEFLHERKLRCVMWDVWSTVGMVGLFLLSMVLMWVCEKF